MAKIDFNFRKPDLTIVRHVVVQRLREDASWNQLDSTGDGFVPYVAMQGQQISQFAYYASEVCWHLLTTGVLAPGFNPSNARLPFFHLTAFGRIFVKTGDWPVYDESEYLVRLGQLAKDPDLTVIAYLTESLRSFERGNFVAASVMLGISAERVFLLLCEATLKSLSVGAEKTTFGKLMERYPIKPKLDWLHAKFGELQRSGPPGFPDNACLTVTAVYDLLRAQRNDLGHPRENPPSPHPENVLLVFKSFLGSLKQPKSFGRPYRSPRPNGLVFPPGGGRSRVVLYLSASPLTSHKLRVAAGRCRLL